LARAPLVHVTGRAVDAAGKPIQGGLGLLPSRRSASVADISVGARIDRDGTFEFPNVLPGEYVLQAWKSRKNSSTEGEFASQFVAVNDSNVTGLVVRMSTGSTISGRFTLEGASPIRHFETDRRQDFKRFVPGLKPAYIAKLCLAATNTGGMRS
jgi:hypothetical protein